MNLLKILPYFIFEKIMTSKGAKSKTLCNTNYIGNIHCYNE